MVFMKKPVYPRPRLLAGGAVRTLGLRRALPHNGAHQPPASCARLRGSPVATTSPLQRWPDTTAGQFTPPRDATQAPGYLARGAVGGRLHALVMWRPLDLFRAIILAGF